MYRPTLEELMAESVDRTLNEKYDLKLDRAIIAQIVRRLMVDVLESRLTEGKPLGGSQR